MKHLTHSVLAVLSFGDLSDVGQSGQSGWYARGGKAWILKLDTGLFLYVYSFIADNISISMYIMCVMLCLFSAFSRRVGALQISIIIIICPEPHVTGRWNFRTSTEKKNIVPPACSYFQSSSWTAFYRTLEYSADSLLETTQIAQSACDLISDPSYWRCSESVTDF